MNIPSIRKQTPRYARKNEAVLGAAARLFNEQGLKGVTLADVAVCVGLNTTSLTYYFGRKEDLAAACLRRSIAAMDAIAEAAMAERNPSDRVASFVRRYVELLSDIAEKRHLELISFQDFRALTGRGADAVFVAYENLFRRVRALMRGLPGGNWPRIEENARAYLILSVTADAQAWIGAYEPDEYERVARRMIDVLLGGLAAGNSAWNPFRVEVLARPPESDTAGAAREAFLQAATELVNEQGYQGASVERISARLKVTKGSFYYHNDSKDDLLLSCFERSFAVIRAAQRAALAHHGSGWERLATATDSLVRHQQSDGGPLLRYRVLNAVPQPARQSLLLAKGRLSARFAGMVTDGITDGSIRPVDPAIAAQLIDAMINAAANLKRWVPAATDTNASALFARPLFEGLLTSAVAADSA